MDENLFDRLAEAELTYLEQQLGEIDPDEVDFELSMGVLTITLSDESKIIVNSHRAARQIWMAAFRQAWHFSPRPEAAQEGERFTWRTASEELRATLGRLLTEKLGRPVEI